MNNVLRKNFLVAFISVSLLLSSIALTPLQASAQTESVDRASLLLQINQLTQLLKVLQARLNAQTPTPSYTLHPVDNQVIQAGEKVVIARLSITPRNVDTYLNKAEFEFHALDGKSLPKDTFESLKVYYKGKVIAEKSLNKTSETERRYGNISKIWYGQKVFEGNIKIPTSGTDKLEFVLEASNDARTSMWEIRIPQNGITVWDKKLSHRYLGDPYKVISFTVATEGASVKSQAEGSVTVVQSGPSTVKVTGELFPPTNCKTAAQFEFLLAIGNGTSKTYTLSDCRTKKISEEVIIIPSLASQYVELVLRQVDTSKNVWVNYTQTRVHINSTNPLNLEIKDITGVGDKG